MLKEVNQVVKAAFQILEQAHEDYAAYLEEEVRDNEGYFLEAPHNMLDSLETLVAEKIKMLEGTEKFRKAKNQIDRAITNFGTL